MAVVRQNAPSGYLLGVASSGSGFIVSGSRNGSSVTFPNPSSVSFTGCVG